MGLREVNRADERPLQEIADALARSHKVLLVTGAGISTSCGIPDFRSKDGLYNIIPDQAIPPTPPPSQPSTPVHRESAASLAEGDESGGNRRPSLSPSSKLRGQDLFDSRIFNDAAGTTTFYRFIASLRQKIQDEVKDTSATHKFVRVLRDGGRLMRCYTQNIDGLEAREGLVTSLSRGKGSKRRFMKKHYEVPRPTTTQNTDFDGGCEVVQLHGDLDKLRCTMCSTQYHWTDEETEIYLAGAAPSCHACKEKSEDRLASGKRGLAVGSLRPNIVLYGEEHPSNVSLTPLIPFDAASQPDVLIIMGTSLKVFGLQKIVREFAKAVHAQKKGRVVFVNRTRPAESTWEGIIDDFVAMDCDDWIEDLRKRRSDLWLRQGDIALAVTKSGSAKRKRKSSAEEDAMEGKKTKKPKPTIEVSPLSEIRRPSPPHTPSRKKFCSTPERNAVGNILSALNGPDHQPLSPVTSTKQRELFANIDNTKRVKSPERPIFSPMTSPVRPESPASATIPRKAGQAGSPIRPVFSPLTPAALNGSKLKMEVYRDEPKEVELDMENLGDVAGDHSDDTETPAPQKATLGTRFKDFVAQVRRLASRQDHELCDEFAEGTVSEDSCHTIEVETPSRGPGARTIHALV